MTELVAGPGDARRIALSLAPGAVALASLAAATWRFRGDYLFPTWLYAVHAALLVAAGAGLAVAGLVVRRRRRTAARLLLAAGASVALLGALDLYVVALRCDSSGPGGALCLTHRRWHERYVRNNRHGFWEDELESIAVERTRAGAKLVAVIGDSFTWGQGVRGRHLRFTDVLQAELRAEGRPVAVANFGVGGTGTSRQVKEILPAVRELAPDVVVIAYLTNDIDDHVSLARIEYPQYSPLRRAAMRLTATGNFIHWTFLAPSAYAAVGERSFFGMITAYRDPENMARHLDDVRRLVRGAGEGGAKVLLVNLPFPHMWAVVNPGHRQRIVAQVLRAAEECGAATLDLEPLEVRFPPGRFELNPLDGHPNPAVHRAMAEALRDALRPWLPERRG